MTETEKAELAWMTLHHATSVLENLYRTGNRIGDNLGFERKDVYDVWISMIELSNKIYEVKNEKNV